MLQHHARAAGTGDQSLFLDVTVGLLEGGLSVRFCARGCSMRPAIKDGDLITVAPLGEGAIRPGEVILYRRDRRPIAHRVQRVIVDAEGGVAVVARGDAKAADDAPVALEQVLGRVVAVERRRASLRSRLGAAWAAFSVWPVTSVAPGDWSATEYAAFGMDTR
jgi:hypothetical protein